MNSISKFVSQERDVAYMVGFDKGEEAAKVEFVTNLLADSNFSPDKIAKIAGVPVEFVRQIQQKLSANE